MVQEKGLQGGASAMVLLLSLFYWASERHHKKIEQLTFYPLLPPIKSLGLFLCMVQFSASFNVEGVSFWALPPQLQNLGILSEQFTFCCFLSFGPVFWGYLKKIA